MTRARIIPPLLIALIFFVAGCAATPASDRPEPFTLPVLTMAELHRLMDETIAAQDDETAQPLAIAHILCGAKFIACRERLANAAIAKPGVLAKARALARIAEKLAAIRQPKRRQPDGAVTGLGRPTPCYDLSRARLVICVDI